MSEDLGGWIGRTRTRRDTISVDRARALAATLDRDPERLRNGDALPPGWHWIYFNELSRRSNTAPDGHEGRGSFLPPVAHPHRMWAGGRVTFPGELRLGEQAERVSTIEAVEEKEGRSGPLVFVTVRHELSQGGELVVRERQDLVYLSRDPARTGPAAPDAATSPPALEWSEAFLADEVTLFRFSALTLNSHRIHYDHPYATGVEGYPHLVVHGPLLALLTLDAGARRVGSGSPPADFTYRARKPVFCGEEVVVGGWTDDDGTTRLAVVRPEGGVATEATLSSR